MRHFKTTPTAAFIFFRSYSRWSQNARESWDKMVARCVLGLAELGKLTSEETELLYDEYENCSSLPSGRYMWCGGTEWSRKQQNYPGQYNCSSTVVDNIATFGYLMDLAAMGCGTGAVLELKNIAKLPPIKTKLNIESVSEIGTLAPEDRQENTLARFDGNTVDLHVGDSRRGWVESYVGLIQLAASDVPGDELNIRVDLSSVRTAGEKLVGFGGTANPTKLPELYGKVAAILNSAIGRQLTSIECCKLIDEAAMVIVAGNIRRSAGIRQFSADDQLALTAKDNLWQQGEDGKWRIDPDRDALRMSNHTRVFHTKPTLQECIDSVRKQYYSGEGAIQWAGEAVARANADLLDTPDKKAVFLGLYPNPELARDWLDKLSKISGQNPDEFELDDRMARYGINPCGEIVMNNNFCNLSEVHLNTIDPFDLNAQADAFRAASLTVAALLHHEFELPSYQNSRVLDPIVGVSFTGLFDFFVHLFGIEWLEWWSLGRPANWCGPMDIQKGSRYYPLLEADFIRIHHFNSMSDLFLSIEEEYLASWKIIVFDTISEYCERHGIKCPNRCTTVQPSGCLTVDAVRVFDQGLLFADEHMNQGSGDVDISNLNLSVRNGIGISYGIANQQMPLIEVILKNGRQIKMTTNHRLFIDDQWIEASEMLPGMSIDFKLGSYTNTSNVLLKQVELKVNRIGRPCTQISVPTHMSEDLAYFVGAMYGNGSIEHLKKRVVFTHASMEVLSKLESIGLQLFGLTCVYKKGSRGSNCQNIIFSSSQLYDWLKAQGLLKECRSTELSRIPLSIRMSSVNSIIGFIAGMIDTDGCISDGGNGVEMYSSSESYMRSIQQVSEAIGLSWSIKSRKQKGTFAGQDIWKLYLSRYHSNQEAITTLNTISIKAAKCPIVQSVKILSSNPYQIVSTTLIQADYTYDYSVNGTNDDDSWYWQGALKSHNSKSLLTGASCGWHPPKAARYIRRMTFGRDEPLALAAIDMGYSVTPSQSDKDENGNLLDDINDPRVTEWLVEIPCATSWTDMPGVDQIEIGKFSALAQFDFYMQVQRHYTTHNTSATLELQEHEIELLATAIYNDIQADGGYMSAALLARFESLETFPRMPFEPIDKERYQQELVNIRMRQTIDNFDEALALHDRGQTTESGPAGCDSEACTLPERK